MVNPHNGSNLLVDFENPPVVEVVCSVIFKPLTAFLTPHIGLLWEKYKSDYPDCREFAPLDQGIDMFADFPPQIKIEIANVPPLPRVWFMQRQGSGIVQVQRDRFLYNWKKVSEHDEYPRYHQVKLAFAGRFSDFRNFVTQNELGTVDPLQFEMTYINHLFQGEGWQSLEDIGKVFPDFMFRTPGERFLPVPFGVNWHTSFLLPERNGRLHVMIRYAKLRETGRPLLILELTVRGITGEGSLDSMNSWFDTAREWIVRGFADLTGKEIQRDVWKRKA
jgi:uncharacterized protein (TIGR04255 family)